MIKEELLDKMEYLYNGGDYKNIIETYDELLKIDNDNPIALNSLVTIMLNIINLGIQIF